MYCRNCGKQLPDGSSFCRYCGAAQTRAAVQAPRPTHEAAPSPARPKGTKKIGLIVAAVALVAAVIAAALIIVPNMGGPCKKAARQFQKMHHYEDVIDNGPAIADLLLGMARSEIDTDLFETVEGNGPDYYSLSGDHLIELKTGLLSLDCEGDRVGSVCISILGGGGLTQEEQDRIRDYALSVYGADCQQSQSGPFVHYTWADADLMFIVFEDGTATADVTYK